MTNILELTKIKSPSMWQDDCSIRGCNTLATHTVSLHNGGNFECSYCGTELKLCDDHTSTLLLDMQTITKEHDHGR